MQRKMKFLSFWSINDGVRTDALCKQMAEMQKHGIEGVVFHPRFYPGGPNYMTSEFIRVVGEVILYAKSLGMEFWIYDENGWPSGAADGQVLKAHPDSKRWGLVFAKEKDLYPDDRVLCCHGDKVVAARGSVGVSPLCRATTDTFLALTHERYFQELPSEAFDYVTGFFCDEVDYFSGNLLSEGAVPWCEDFEALYMEKYGDSPCGELWKLFDTEAEHPEFKTRFWETAGDLIARNFYQPYAEWCDRHGKLFTGHLKGEESPYFQLMFSGSCFTQLKHLSMPAIDTLERYAGNHFFPYLLASVAAQQGREGCLAEAMGGAGWGVAPEDLKKYMLWLAEAGVDRIVLHLGQFVLKAKAIRDWPPSVPLHLTWHEAFADVLAEIREASMPLLARAWEMPKTLIVTPTRGVMAWYRPHNASVINLHDGTGIPDSRSAQINAAFLDLVERCYEAGWNCHFTEERELKNARLRNGRLYFGKMYYENVLIAPGCYFDSDEKLLINTMALSGMLCEAPKASADKAQASVCKEITIPRQTAWKISFPKENQLLVEWEITSNGKLKTEIPTKNITSELSLVLSDPIKTLTSNVKIQAVNDAKTHFMLSEIGEHISLEIEPDAAQPLPFAWVRGDFAVLSTDGWCAFDRGQVSCNGHFLLDGSENVKKLSAGELVTHGLPFFGGLLHAEKRFSLTERYIGELSFDQLRVSAARVMIDGKEIGWWWKEHPLAISLVPGEHTLSVEAAASTYNMYGPHHYYLGDCRLTSPDTFFGKGGYTDNADAPANTLIETMQFVRFALDGNLILSKRMEFQPNGSSYITAKIEEAVQNETRNAVIRGNHLIDQPIRIPSNFTLILEDCHLRLADGVYCNIFVNEHHDTELGRTVSGTDRNISIIGRGRAILDVGEYNGLSERNFMQDGLPPIWKNNLILFTNVDGFMIRGLHCRNQRWWALNFVYCSNGYLGNIDFCANDTAIDANGNRYHGLKHSKYKEILVKNADGIDLRQGCHHITIENITGFTEDDSIALTGLDWHLEKHFKVDGLPSDICDITIKNIATSAFCTNVRLLNQGEIKLHDILIDGVYDTSADSPHMERGLYAVRVGDTSMYGTRHATSDETYNITIKNVYSRGKYAVALAGEMKNLVMYGIECENGTKLLLDERIVTT